MTEYTYILNSADPVIFYGVNNSNIRLLKVLFPKIKIMARGNTIKATGDEVSLADFDEKIVLLEKHATEFNDLSEAVITDIVKGKLKEEVKPNNLILHGLNGKPITARTANQEQLLADFDKNDLMFATGPAGSGKTYTAIALAVRALKTSKKNYSFAPSRRSWRKTWFPTRRYERQNRPIFTTAIRCA